MWLGRLAALMVVLAVFTWLGLWQWGVAYDRGRVEALQRQAGQRPLPLNQVIAPHAPFPDGGMNRPVTVVGRYEPDKQLLVPARRLDGRDGYWVLTPMVVASSGARLVVIRGFVAKPALAAPAPSAEVTVAAVLAQPESPPTRLDLPVGQIGSVDLGILLNHWGGQIYNAFVFAQSEHPDTLAGSAIVRVPPPRLATGEANLRNLLYAVQWWAFAILAVYVFVRVLREEHAATLAPPRSIDEEAL